MSAPGAGTDGSLEEFTARLPLVDHHVHGAFRGPVTREGFEESLNEGSTGAVPSGTTSFDSQLGFAVRRWCAPLLDLPAHAPAEEYWARRSALGEAEVARRLLSAAGVGHWIVDAGYGAQRLLSPARLAQAGGGEAHEVVRLEALAESLAARGRVRGRDYADAFRDLLREAARDAVGAKTVVAYRAGLDLDWSVPEPAAVRRAADGWLGEGGSGPAPGTDAGSGSGGTDSDARSGTGTGSGSGSGSDLGSTADSGGASAAGAGSAGPRLADPVLLRFGVHCAVELGLPLQIHTGFGDRDLDLHRANPLLLTDLLRRPEVAAVPVMLLHCYPFHREAGYLAQAFDRVYCDVGLAVNHVGARAAAVVAESMELAPFGRLLYSSDAWGPAELHFLGAALWRRATATAVGSWVGSGDWSAADARRVVTMIGRENALRAYGL